jgi:hypothetical protein
VSQVEEKPEEGDVNQTALQRVLAGHVERTKALRERTGMLFMVLDVSREKKAELM